MPDETDLPPEVPFEGEEDAAAHDAGPHDESILDRMRGTGVGVEDENIVGDVGPTDVPPGRDPDGPADLLADPPVEGGTGS